MIKNDETVRQEPWREIMQCYSMQCHGMVWYDMDGALI
jgi:hypothetical protein